MAFSVCFSYRSPEPLYSEANARPASHPAKPLRGPICLIEFEGSYSRELLLATSRPA
jgi:hypothetical protein